MLTAYFYHKLTGLPLTDPAVTVSVTLANMNNDIKVLDNVAMTPSASIPGAFRHNYNLDMEIDYMAYYSCSDDNYGEKTTQYYFPARPVAGGGGVNISGVQTTIRNSRDTVVSEIKKLNDFLETQFNETNSRIEVAKGEITDKIESIDIPEVKFEESEARKATKMIEKVDKKLSSYIESEMIEKQQEKAKEEAEKEEEMRKQEEARKMEEERQRKEKEIEDMLNMEFDKLDEEEKMEKKKELEKELEETLKEAEEIKKELNSL